MLHQPFQQEVTFQFAAMEALFNFLVFHLQVEHGREQEFLLLVWLVQAL
jgi:hypothetical protein